MTEQRSDRERRQQRRRRARQGWIPPGGMPPGDQGDPDLRPTGEETLDHVSGHWRIFQRKDGNRFSTDDFLCAWWAGHLVRTLGLEARDYLDLGTGIGSVGLMVSWTLPEVHYTGIEAQEVSAALAARSIRYNGLQDRSTLILGDLRDEQLLPAGPRFDLITATPPYLPLGAGLESHRPQRAPARFVHRGGVGDYAAAAARCLRPGGLFVLVFAAYRPQDVPPAAQEAGLEILAKRLVIPREGKDPLLELTAMTLANTDAPSITIPDEEPILVRNRDGQWTDSYQVIRGAMGFPLKKKNAGSDT